MRATTAEVKELVVEVLATITRPYSEDVTDEVCTAIEGNDQWRATYDRLRKTLGQDTLNRSIGRYVSKAVGGRRLAIAKPTSSLINSYSKLSY